MSHGITEEDRRRMGEMSSAVNEGAMGPENVDAETCAGTVSRVAGDEQQKSLRQRIADGEVAVDD